MSELQAVNYCLDAIGESPVTTLSTQQADVQRILNLLSRNTEEVLSMQWQFNTEFGYQLLPAGQLTWTSQNPYDAQPYAVASILNVFEAPPSMQTFKINPSSLQSGFLYPDMVIRRAQYFQDPTVVGLYPMVFYDRANNREGLLASAYPFLGLDITWRYDFVDLPTEAQLYIAAKSARMYVERGLNSSEIAGFLKLDEAYAYRHLRRQWGIKDNYNMLRTQSAWQTLGYRPALNAGFIDNRGLPISYPPPAQPSFPTLTLVAASLTVTVAPSSTGNTQVWTLTNTSAVGGPVGTYQVAVAVDGTYVTSAIISPAGRFSLQPGDALSATVTFATGATAGQGYVTIMFMNEQVADATQTLVVTVS